MEISVVVALALALLAGRAAAAEDTSAGPMALPALGLLQNFQFSPTLFGPDEVRSGRWYQNTAFNWINVWAFHIEADRPYRAWMDPASFPFQYGSFLVDYEGLLLTHHIGYRITDRADIIVALPVFYIGGGSLDGFIEGFHRGVGIDQHRRADLPRDSVHLFFVDHEGRQHWLGADDLSGGELGNIALYGGANIGNGAPAASVRLGVKLPTQTAREPVDDKGIDVALTYGLAWEWGRTRWFHGAGVTHSTSPSSGLPHFRRIRGTAAFSAELPWNRRPVSLLAHLVAGSPSADYPQLDEEVVELTFGLRIYRGRSRIDVGLIENMFFYDNSPDFGIHVAIMTR